MRSFLRYYLPVIFWAALIFFLSGREFSGNTTYRWLASLLEALFGVLSPSTLQVFNAVLRKLAHVIEYFVLGLLLWRACRGSAELRWRARWAVSTLGLGVAWAAADETYQVFQPSRTGSVFDVGYDFLGLLLALVLVYGYINRERATSTALQTTRQ